MKQAILGYEQQFYINGTQISGVQGVDGSYGVQEKPINILGWGHVNQNFQPQGGLIEQEHDSFVLTEDGFRVLQEGTCRAEVRDRYPKSLAVLSSPLEGTFSINSMLISEDFFLRFTGDNPFTGSIHHGSTYFGFNSGYITSHSVSCGVGQLPTTSTSIQVFGDIGGSHDLIRSEDNSLFLQEDLGGVVQEGQLNTSEYNASGSNPFPEIKIPNQKSISVRIKDSLDEESEGITTDRIISFNHSIRIGVEPIYIVGSSRAAQVDVTWPVTTETVITIEIDEYRYQRLRAYLRRPTLHDLTIRMEDCTGSKIQEYVVKEARLTSESMSASIDGRLTANLSYISYYNKR
jgi:hypothetical protein